MPSIAQLLVKIGLDSSALATGLDRETQRVKRFAGEMQSAGLALSVGVTAPLVGLGAAALKTAGEMEQAQVAFTTLLKSSSAATEHLRELKSFALTTPFQFTDLTRLSRLMQAYGSTAQEVVPKLKILGNAVSALGGNSEVFERVIRSMGEIGTRGKVTGEQLRELSRAGIPALEAIATALGVSVAEAQRQITAGTVDAKTASEALLQYMDTRFKGGMEAQSKTLLGLFSNVKDQIVFTLSAVGQSLVPLGKDLLQGYIQPALESITRLAEAFARLPKPVQEAALGTAAFAAAIPVATVAAGVFFSNAIQVSQVMQKMSGLLFGAGGLIAGLGATALAFTGMGAAATALVGTGVLLASYALGSMITETYNWYAALRDSDAATKTFGTAMDRLTQRLKTLGVDLHNFKPPAEEEITKWDLFWAAVGGSILGTGDYSEVERKLRANAELIRRMQVQLANLAGQSGAGVLPGVGTGTINIAEINKRALAGLNLKSTADRKKDLQDAQAYYKTLQSLGVENSEVLVEAAQRVKEAQEALYGSFDAGLGRVRDYRKEYENLLAAYQKGGANSTALAAAYQRLAQSEENSGATAKQTSEIWRQFYAGDQAGLWTCPLF